MPSRYSASIPAASIDFLDAHHTRTDSAKAATAKTVQGSNANAVTGK